MKFCFNHSKNFTLTNMHCETVFISAEKGCVECLNQNYSKNVNDINLNGKSLSDIAIENGNIEYAERLNELLTSLVPHVTISTPSENKIIVPISASVSSIIQNEIIDVKSPVVKLCPHGLTAGHQLIATCSSGYDDYCCGTGRQGGGWCRRCGGNGYISRCCPHGQVRQHTYVAGFCNGPSY